MNVPNMPAQVPAWAQAAALALMLSLGPSEALAASTTGSTTLLEPPLAGTSVDVDVAVTSDAPVVAYDYALLNECFFSGKVSGRADAYQRDEIAAWDSSVGPVPHATMEVHLQPVPAGALCVVSVVKGNTTVKGSATQYVVQ